MGYNLSRIGDRFGDTSKQRIEREKEAEILLAQGQRVIVNPLIHIEQIELMESTLGPFYPMVPTAVPLYAALLLKHANCCTIYPPEYLSIRYLQRAIQEEEFSHEEFSAIDMYIFENAYACLENCEIVEDISEIRILLEKLKEIRLKKLLKGIEYIDTPVIGTNNLTFFEFRKIKEYILPHMEIQKSL